MYVCKDCKVSKPRIAFRTPSGKLRNVDAEGRYWAGRRCGPCQSKHIAATVKQSRKHLVGARIKLDESVREKGGATLGPKEVLYPPKLRPCKVCSVACTNYFFCNACQVRIKGRNPEAFYASELEETVSVGIIGDGAGWRY